MTLIADDLPPTTTVLAMTLIGGRPTTYDDRPCDDPYSRRPTTYDDRPYDDPYSRRPTTTVLAMTLIADDLPPTTTIMYLVIWTSP